MDDVRKLVEDLINQLRELARPAPPPRRGTKWGLSVGGLMLALLLGWFIRVWYKGKAADPFSNPVPYAKISDDNQAE
jgi:hypothetical protein